MTDVTDTYQAGAYQVQITRVPTCLGCIEWFAVHDRNAPLTGTDFDPPLRQVRIYHPVIVAEQSDCDYDHD